MASTVSKEEVRSIIQAEHSDPFQILGIHPIEIQGQKAIVVRAFLPEAKAAWVIDMSGVGCRVSDVGFNPASSIQHPMERVHPEGFFEAVFPERSEVFSYRLKLTDHQGHTVELDDPYAFPPLLTDFDLYLLAEGTHYRNYEKLGAHVREIHGIRGVHFAVWAPNARRVSVVGDFNNWDGRLHGMRLRVDTGIWEIFAPDVPPGASYKFEIVGRDGQMLPLKADPYARRA
ncbi:MAG: GlgB N-terminal domain-containing protein, partial [Candidatus Methylomirabilales bacterium]